MEGIATTTSVAPGLTGGAKGSTATAAPAAASDAGSGAGTTFSTTNDQEAGVDEPDIAKTDGSTIFTLAQDKLEAVSVTGASPKLVGTLDLGTAGANAQLLLYGTARARRLDPFDDLRRAAADRRIAPRLALLGLRIADGDHRGRRARPLGHGGHADDVRRRPVRRRPPERLERPDRHQLGATRDRRAAARRGGIGLGPVVAVQGRPQRPPLHASGRVVRDDPPARAVLRARDGEHRHRELHEGAAGGAIDLPDGRRPDRLRIADEPLHRDSEVGPADTLARPAAAVAGRP